MNKIHRTLYIFKKTKNVFGVGIMVLTLVFWLWKVMGSTLIEFKIKIFHSVKYTKNYLTVRKKTYKKNVKFSKIGQKWTLFQIL